VVARVTDKTIAAIERAQKRLQEARGHVREVLRRQEERLEESRRLLEWLRR
jgi:exonuclease VII small subunit